MKMMEKDGLGTLNSKRSIPWSLFFIALVACPVTATGEGQGKWTIRAPLPSPRTEVAAVQLLGKIFVIGGLGRSGDLLEEYDPDKKTWRRRASLPQPLHHVGAVTTGGKIYVIGGYLSGWGPVDTVYTYDPSCDKCGRPCLLQEAL
jgi:N-acetylneuraminic acid mutarotase